MSRREEKLHYRAENADGVVNRLRNRGAVSTSALGQKRTSSLVRAMSALPPKATYGPGAFLGELAQLAGRPALVNATARGPVEALIIPPDQLRSLLVAEAELGERIMRALILRRIGLMETGAGGPVIV